MSNILNLNAVWCEKYRPKTLDDIILDTETRRTCEKFQKESEIPNLLFCGVQGTGKTSLAKIIVTDVLKCNFLYLNASDESGIDTIRSKVNNFAQTKSFDGKVKVVILDEADGMTSNAQQILRNTMESYANTCRFILTANYKHKIIPPLQSRCQLISPKPDIKSAASRILAILKGENIEVSKEQSTKLVELIKLYFPDLRKIINELQKNVINNKLQINNVKIDNSLSEKIFEAIKNRDTISLRKHLIKNEEMFNGDYDELLKQFLNYVYELNIDNTKKRLMIAAIAEHLFRAAMILDHEINAFACWIMLEDCWHGAN